MITPSVKKSATLPPGPAYLLTLFMLISGGILWGQEGNYKFENFGNQSVLLSGNLTGSVADLGLVYYNPARLGLIENPSFTIGGKAYQWSKYYFENILQTYPEADVIPETLLVLSGWAAKVAISRLREATSRVFWR